MKRAVILKYLVNILAVALFGAVAFLFIGYGLTYKSLDVISRNFDLLFWLSAAVLLLFTALGIIFYCVKKQSAYRLVLCVLICADVFAVMFFTLCASGLIQKITSVDALREYIGQAGSAAAAIYILFCFLQVILLPVPGSATVAVGVAMFGPFKCAVFSFAGIVLGSIVAFAVGRWIGYKAVRWIVGQENIDKWLKKLKGKDYLILSLMFLLPLFPDDVLCFVAGLSSMTWQYFLVMITITRAISVISTSYTFELIPFTTWWGIMIWLVLLALVVLSFYLVCKYSDKIDSFLKTKLKLGGNGKSNKQ